MAMELMRRGLPKSWSFAITRDGRIFFINDSTRCTTWLHPVTGQPICTGNTPLPDLPAEWERGVTGDGIPYYVDHNKQETTFVHPVRQESAVRLEGIRSPPLPQQHQPRPPVLFRGDDQVFCTGHIQPASLQSHSTHSMEQRKVPTRKKLSSGNIRSPMVKRDHLSPVTLAGWLYKLEGGALKQWKKRWFVLADFCLFYYKDMDEDKLLGSILLPSYKINLCTSEDRVSRKFTFKAAHQNMKTFYFAAESKESFSQWMNAMSLASIMQKDNCVGILAEHSYGSPVMLDEEDSGFTSYRSRRAASQDHSANMSGSFSSDQLNSKLRRNSEGSHLDRTAENGYLGSDQKYPVSYIDGRLGNQDERQHRKPGQPVYANAPPKPRRNNGPPDNGYANYPYPSDTSSYQQNPYGQHMGHPMPTSMDDRRSSTHSSSNGSVHQPPSQGGTHGPPSHSGSWPAGMPYQDNYVYGSGYYPRDSDERQPSMYQPHPSQEIRQHPPRPHSADFLERECYMDSQDFAFQPEPGPRSVKHQPPPRPKSSLDQYSGRQYCQNETDPYINSLHHRNELLAPPDDWGSPLDIATIGGHNHSVGPPPDYPDMTHSHPNLYGNSGYIMGSQDYMMYQSASPMMRDSGGPRPARPVSAGYELHDSAYNRDQKKAQLREESLKRLLEWKQRMLQSPLSRKYTAQRPSSTGPVESSSLIGTTPCRPPLPEEYKQKVLQDLENHEARFQPREAPSVQMPVGKTPVYEAQMQKAAHYDPHYAPQAFYSSSHQVAYSPLHPQHPPATPISNSSKDLYRQQENIENIQPHVLPKGGPGRPPESPYTYRERSRSASSAHKEMERPSSAHGHIGANKKTKSSCSLVRLPNSFSSDDEAVGTKEHCTDDVSHQAGSLDTSTGAHEITSQRQQQQSLSYPDYVNLNSIQCQHDASPVDNDADELYIRREDYYRASQLFYSKKVFNDFTKESPEKQIVQVNCIDSTSMPSSKRLSNGPQDYNVSETVWKLDRDIGLPLLSSADYSSRSDRTHKRFSSMSNSLMQQNGYEDPSSSLEDIKIDMGDPIDLPPLKRSSSTDIYDNQKEKSDFHRQASLRDRARKEFLDSQNSGSSLKLNYSFEEMRSMLQKKKEAPPPNIVSQRIKHFEESVNKSPDESKKSSPCAAIGIGELLKRSPSTDTDEKKEKVNLTPTSQSVPSESKVDWQVAFQRKRLFTDSEVESEDVPDERVSMKSAPLILSPLSSVLADLRRTADTKKDKGKKDSVDEVIITKGALRLSMAETINLSDQPKEADFDNEKSIKNSNKTSPNYFSSQPVNVDDEEEYLPMKGGRPIEEPVYVSMDAHQRSSYCQADSAEPVYNEPAEAPASFLHDVFGKQKKSNPNLDTSSSSDDGDSSNLYEKPNWKDYPSKPVEVNTDVCAVYEEPYANKSVFQSGNKLGWMTREQNCHIPNRKVHTDREDTVPDLLHHEEMKHSDASDADDEASRDFDTPQNISLPSYQKEILFDDAAQDNLHSRQHAHKKGESSCDSLDSKPYNHYRIPEEESRFTEFLYKAQSSQKLPGDHQMTMQYKQTQVLSEQGPSHSRSVNECLGRGDKSTLIKMEHQLETSRKVSISSCSSPLSPTSTNDQNPPAQSFGPVPQMRPTIDNSTIPQLYPTPDVIPFETPDEVTAAKLGLKLQRSPNSAPYYYSDLLPEKLGENPDGFSSQNPELHLSPRSSRALLNNVRDISPNNLVRGDIGRKVNQIHRTPQPEPNQQPLNNSSDLAEELSQAMAHELRASLEQLLGTESKKFRDAERNKYQAGHTLEKTPHQSSPLYKMKQRSATPDFDTFCRPAEPEYENIGVSHTTTPLSKRLSRSLEGLIDCSATSEVSKDERALLNEAQLAKEPYYENIDFIRLSEDTLSSQPTSFPDKAKLASPQAKAAQHSILEQSDSSLPYDAVSLNSSHDIAPPRSVSLSEERDSDSEYLDENVLRRESKRHFLVQGFGEKLGYKRTSDVKSTPVTDKDTRNQPSSATHHFLGVGQRANFDGGGSSLSCSGAEDDSRPVDPLLGLHLDGLSSSSSDQIDALVSVPESAMSCMQAESRKVLLRKKLKLSQEALNVSDSEIHKQTSSKVRRLIQRSQGLSRHGKRLSISAGDLLEKSHEELVLLLIQLRRSQSRIASTQEKCLAQLETSKQMAQRGGQLVPEHVANCEKLRCQMQELNKQQELTQPLINLVDNMVKLGSLYKGQDCKTPPPLLSTVPKTIPMSQELFFPSEALVGFSNWVTREQSPDECSLQENMFQLYDLNRAFYDETNMLTSLHQDKDMLESTLESVRNKVSDARDNPVTVQKLKKQQVLLEKELARVRNLLTQSAQKIEDISAENGKLEVEILALRQKIYHALKQINPAAMDPLSCTRAELEAELNQVQKIIEDLGMQRQEISNALEHLRQEAYLRAAGYRGGQQVSPVRASPTGVAGVAPLPLRRKSHSSYLETDLDSLETRNLASLPGYLFINEDSPLYVNAGDIDDGTQGGGDSCTESPLEPISQELNYSQLSRNGTSFSDPYLPCDINEADDKMKRFYGILPREKPSEIKTVRIVKRESERRNKVRERKKVTYDENSLVWLVEEQGTPLSDDNEDQSDVVFEDSSSQSRKRPTSLLLAGRGQQGAPGFLSAHQQLFGGPLRSPSSLSSETSPSSGPPNQSLMLLPGSAPEVPSLGARVPFKKVKRRHYTISGSQPFLEQSSPKMSPGPRSRDDMDMERCLRTVNTPDIVRSTIKKSDVFDDKLIDRELGLPQKIVIPERYIEIEPEELSASEKLRRSQKAETIRKMLSETTTRYEDLGEKKAPSETLKKKLDEEKKRRSHLLALNHVLAREVMERSKMVAVMATLERLDPQTLQEEARRHQVELEDLSPDWPMPITQQRENFLT